jgi:hypothetical protein
MLTSAEWLALATSGIGIAGTLAGATITQAFANKREKRQSTEDREKQAQLWEREDSLRFHADKKIAYSTFIGKMHLWLSQMLGQVEGNWGGQAYPPDGFNEFQAEIMTLRAQIELIAPGNVWTAAEVVWASGVTTALTLGLPDMYPKDKRRANVSGFGGELVKCIAAMRVDLSESSYRLTTTQQTSTDSSPRDDKSTSDLPSAEQLLDRIKKRVYGPNNPPAPARRDHPEEPGQSVDQTTLQPGIFPAQDRAS